MPVSAVRAFGMSRRTDRCFIRPECREWLEAAGLRTAADFLSLPGVVVSGHIGRNVSRIEIAGATAYLKREHHVRIRDRFRSWRDGFGWQSVSAREAAVLRRLDEYQLPGPRWLAHGEAGGTAFLLVAAVEGAVDLRSVRHSGRSLPERLGRVVARLHAAGVDQPDLFAKHILIQPDTDRITILDWQRAVLRAAVPWRARIRTLAALVATVGEVEFRPDAVNRLVAAYRAAAAALGGRIPSPVRLAREVDRQVASLVRRRGIRSQRAPAVVQELVRIAGETVCAIPGVASELGTREAIARLYDPAGDGSLVTLSAGRTGVLRVRAGGLRAARWLAALRGRAWRSPELRVARLLFHLERFSIPGPKLLAYGQRSAGFHAAGSFVLYEPRTAGPLRAGDRPAAGELLARLHAVGCRLTGVGDEGGPFGVEGGAVVVRDIGSLRLVRAVSARQARRDMTRLETYFAGCR
jgi:tRNA A-37 threonylcarbamoyl transferase component Bud32